MEKATEPHDEEPIARQTEEMSVSGSSIKIEKTEVTTKLEFFKGFPVPNGETKCQKVDDIDYIHSNTGLWVTCS